MINENPAVEVNLDNFQQIMMQDSMEKLVLVQFWSPRSSACEALTPVLHKLASQHSEHLLYTRVNCDEQAQIAAQFGIQGLPTVILVKEGQPVDGAAGPQDEAQLKDLLAKHLPQPEDTLFTQAQELVKEGEYHQAFTAAKQAYELNAERADIKLLLADCYVEIGQLVQAKALIETIGLVDQDTYYQSIVGKIELAEQASESPEIKALQAALEASPQDNEIKLKLAVQLHQSHQSEQALEHLFAILKQDLNFSDAKKTCLDIINALPDGDPLKSKYRRKIYSLLY